jgi:hypothetical protein
VKLLKTIYSDFNKGEIYGKAGEEVELINKKGVVWLVKLKGAVDGFPALKCDISCDDDALILDDAPRTASINTITNKGVGSRRKATPINQAELFK